MNTLPENHAHPWPRLVFWETTAACNLVCSHCRRTEVADELSPDELSSQEAESLIDELSGWGRTILVFSGGEPLLRPDIFRLMSYANEKGLDRRPGDQRDPDRPGSGQAHPGERRRSGEHLSGWGG